MKTTEIIVVDKGAVLGSVSLFDLLKEHSKATKIKDLKKYGKNYAVVSPLSKMTDIPDGLVICVDNKTFLGVVKN